MICCRRSSPRRGTQSRVACSFPASRIERGLSVPAKRRRRPVSITQERVLEALRQTYDPCCEERGISIVDMGLVHRIDVRGTDVSIELVLTSGWCPFQFHLLSSAEDRVRALTGVEQVTIRIVWDPVWTPERLSESARKKLSLPLERLLPLREERLKEARR